MGPGQNLVGRRVKEARGRLKPRLTQEELSRRLCRAGVAIDRAGVAKIETGIRGVLDYEVVAFSRVLGVKASWLLGLKE